MFYSAVNCRSREVSGQQTSQMFASGFMSSQGGKEDVAVSSSSDGGAQEKPYDIDGNAHLESVLLVMKIERASF